MRRLRSDCGQAMVEFVLLFPLALLLILVMAESGFALNTYMRVTTAAAEGARLGAVAALPSAACSPDSIQGRVIEAGGSAIGCAEIAVTYQKSGIDVVRGDGVAVRVTHTYQPITPLGELLELTGSGSIPETLTMVACANGRVERAPSNQGVLIGGAGC